VGFSAQTPLPCKTVSYTVVLCGTPALLRRDGYIYNIHIKRGVSGRPLYFPLPRAGEMGYYVGWARKVDIRAGGGARDVWKEWGEG